MVMACDVQCVAPSFELLCMFEDFSVTDSGKDMYIYVLNMINTWEYYGRNWLRMRETEQM